MEPTGTNGRTRHTLSDPLVGGLGLVLWWFSRWMARNAVSCGHDDDTGKAFDLLASVVRFPDRHDRNRGWFRCRPPVFRLAVLYWFCGGHGPGETPGPFPNPEAKAWHGDGTALERVWESSAPPHSFVGGSRRASAPGTPIFYALLCRPAGRSTLPRGAGRGSAGDTEFVTANQSGAHWGCVLDDRDDIRHACQPTCLRIQTLAT